MKKHLTFFVTVASVALSMNAHAESYFFSPDGSGEQDGTSWENAAPAEYLPSTIANAEPGDCFYLMGGSYINKVDVVWNIPQGITIRGGYPTTSTGTNIDITYPTNSESVFSADIDGDGEGDNGTTAFFSIDNVNSDPDMSNFQKTIIAGVTIRDAHSKNTSTYKGSALYANNANVEFDHVKFIKNTTDVGGGVCAFVGSYIYAHDCVWSDNLGIAAGAAVVSRQKGGGTTAGVQGGVTIFDRCLVLNNTVKEPNNSSVAKYGGALAFADNCGTVYMANTTVTGSHISWAGAMARIGGNVVFYGINNTWYNCTCSYASRHSGDILSCGTGSKVYVAANIGVTPTDGRSGGMATHLVQGGSGAVFNAYGYNIFGSISDALNTSYPSTNSISGDNVESVVFGSNTLADNGGFTQTIAPKADYCIVPLSEITALASTWSLPAEIDLTVDQRGMKRQATTYVGSYDVNAKTATAISTVQGESASLAISNLGDGCYRVTGATGQAHVYNLTGKCIFSTLLDDSGLLNLSAAPKGVYILSVGGVSAKVVRF